VEQVEFFTVTLGCSTIAGGKHSAADVVAKAQAVLSESELLRAMFDVRLLSAEHAARISAVAMPP
jgi:hypothetical protein